MTQKIRAVKATLEDKNEEKNRKLQNALRHMREVAKKALKEHDAGGQDR